LYAIYVSLPLAKLLYKKNEVTNKGCRTQRQLTTNYRTNLNISLS